MTILKYKIDTVPERDNLLTVFGKTTLTDRYLQPGETFQDLFARVASAYADDQPHAQRLYDAMSQLWFMPSTPVLSNGGTDRGLPIACYLNETDDSMQGIAALWQENIWLANKGGGIGSYWGNVRSIGETVKGAGKTSGIIPFLKVQDALTLAISQGSLRRGSSAVYIPIDHPEIEEFLEIRRPTGGDPNRKAPNIHHGVCIPDAFMHAVRDGLDWDLLSPNTKEVVSTVKARDLWIRLLLARIETGEPYILYTDTANRALPAHHEKLGLKVKMSNLCVAPETLILTDEGYVEIKSRQDLETTVWNGFEFSKVVVRKTGIDQKLIKVSLSDGANLECTPEHIFYVKRNYRSKAVKVKAANLKKGDKLMKWGSAPTLGMEDVVFDSQLYTNGFFSGDGTQRQGTKFIWLYAEKIALAQHMSLASVGTYNPKQDRVKAALHQEEMYDKFFVPHKLSFSEKLSWLAGLMDADACVARNGSAQCLQLCNINLHFLNEIKLMCNTLGVRPIISIVREKGQYPLPNNKGGNECELYDCQSVYRLLFNTADTEHLREIGLPVKRLVILPQSPQRDARGFVTVAKLEDLGRISDTYCFTEHLRNLGVFNGILTGQCSEILLPTGIDHLGKNRTAVCCLASMNLETYPQWESNALLVHDVMAFLDNVLQDFIDRAPPEFANAIYSASRERSVGLGVMGFHSLLQQKGIPFESVMAQVWNKKVFQYIREEADMASKSIACAKGACPDAAQAGISERFSYKMAVAPTASISTIAGNSSPGIEPYAANAYTHKTLSGSFGVKNKHLAAVLETYGKDTDEVWSIIFRSEGSVKELNFLTDLQKDVFKTAMEIDPAWVVELAAGRTPYICQGQSVNLFLPADISKKQLHDIHFAAWEKGVKSLYYCRSTSLKRAEKAILNPDECLSCQ